MLLPCQATWVKLQWFTLSGKILCVPIKDGHFSTQYSLNSLHIWLARVSYGVLFVWTRSKLCFKLCFSLFLLACSIMLYIFVCVMIWPRHISNVTGLMDYWWRAGIRSTNLHIVLEWLVGHLIIVFKCHACTAEKTMKTSTTGPM